MLVFLFCPVGRNENLHRHFSPKNVSMPEAYLTTSHSTISGHLCRVRPRPPAPKKKDQPRVGLSFLSRWPERKPTPTFFPEKCLNARSLSNKFPTAPNPGICVEFDPDHRHQTKGRLTVRSICPLFFAVGRNENLHRHFFPKNVSMPEAYLTTFHSTISGHLCRVRTRLLSFFR